MSNITCPKEMVLQKEGGPIHPNEPAYCINVTEVDQQSDQKFWTEKRQKSGYKLVVTKKDGTTDTISKPDETSLRKEAAGLIQNSDILGVDVHPVVKEKPQPGGSLAGPKKAATIRTWEEAREYCKDTYPGGDLATERQWEKACGDTNYCTSSKKLKRSEADYGGNLEEGPANVDAFPANTSGVKGMTGGVWEWTLGEKWGKKIIRGGSFLLDATARDLEANFLRVDHPDSGNDIGYRCVSPPIK